MSYHQGEPIIQAITQVTRWQLATILAEMKRQCDLTLDARMEPPQVKAELKAELRAGGLPSAEVPSSSISQTAWSSSRTRTEI